MKAVVLAAGVGRRLRSAHDLPKCLVAVGGEPLLGHYLDSLAKSGVREVSLVVGYRREAIAEYLDQARAPARVSIIENPDFERGSVLSLRRARETLHGPCLLMDADVYFERSLLQRLLGCPSENALLIDSTREFTGEEVLAGARGGRVAAMARGLEGKYDVLGEWVGFAKLGELAARRLGERADEMVRGGDLDAAYEDVLATLFDDLSFGYELVDGLHWVEIDFPEDLAAARKLAAIWTDRP